MRGRWASVEAIVPGPSVPRARGSEVSEECLKSAPGEIKDEKECGPSGRRKETTERVDIERQRADGEGE